MECNSSHSSKIQFDFVIPSRFRIVQDNRCFDPISEHRPNVTKNKLQLQICLITNLLFYQIVFLENQLIVPLADHFLF